MTETKKILIQCDFDGTITKDDLSFLLLDAFADGDWRQRLKKYEDGKITVGRFNMEAFPMIKADRESLLEVIRHEVKVRPGFQEMVTYCRRRGFRFVIVSNGLDFYIEETMNGIGLEDIEILSAKTRFSPEGLQVYYVGPDGKYLDDDFKGTYVNEFLGEGYRVIYVGNGTSDIIASRQCQHIFATGNLLNYFQKTNLDYTPFTHFNEIIKVLERW